MNGVWSLLTEKPQCSNRGGRVFKGKVKVIKREKKQHKKGQKRKSAGNMMWNLKTLRKSPQLAAGISYVALEDETLAGPLEDGGDKISNSDSEMTTWWNIQEERHSASQSTCHLSISSLSSMTSVVDLICYSINMEWGDRNRTIMREHGLWK